MKYFKTLHNGDNPIDLIAAEMVNITFGETIFGEDGQLLDVKIPGHNTYLVDSVEYQIMPNCGYVYILANENNISHISGLINSKFSDKMMRAITKYRDLQVPVASVGTTQYVMVDMIPPPAGRGVVVELGDSHTGLRGTPFYSGDKFVWMIPPTLSMPISDLVGDNTVVYSMSSIVLDTLDVIDLPSGYKSVDYPRYSDYKIYKQNRLLEEEVHFDATHGIHRELLKHIDGSPKIKQSKYRFHNVKEPIKLVKYEWLKPYTASESVLTYIELIDRGFLDIEQSEEVSLNCFITGLPLYDDCYVFDIYERRATAIVEETELNFDDYPDYVVDPTFNQDSDENTKEQTKDSKGKSKNNTEQTKDETDDETDPPKDKTKNETKKTVKKTVKKAVKKTSDEDEPTIKEEPDTKKTIKINPKSKPKAPILRKGAKPPAKKVKINFTKKYTTPKCVLVSTHYMHMLGEEEPVKMFERRTNSRVLVYRTKVPVTVMQIIDKYVKKPAYQTVLKRLYHNAFQFDYKTITCSGENKVLLYKLSANYRRETLKLITTNSTDIIGDFVFVNLVV